MADAPGGLERSVHLELRGRRVEIWSRRVVLVALTGLIAAGLANVFGQRADASRVTNATATLSVEAPSALRGGLFYQATFAVHARDPIAKPQLALADGWTDSMTLNTVEPAPTDEEYRDGRLVLTFPPLDSGRRLVVRLQYQVNPTALGTRDQAATLLDAGRQISEVRRSAFVYP